MRYRRSCSTRSGAVTTAVCGPEPPTHSNRTFDTRLDDLNERVKELVNEVRRIRDKLEPPDLPPMKVSTTDYSKTREG